jgi:predicted metal-dependent hydrolase
VIIHEISHLLVSGHGKKFWNVVAKIIPDYKQIRKELRDCTVILD